MGSLCRVNINTKPKKYTLENPSSQNPHTSEQANHPQPGYNGQLAIQVEEAKQGEGNDQREPDSNMAETDPMIKILDANQEENEDKNTPEV